MTAQSGDRRETVRVSIIIVNWNGLQHLDPCLRSLARQTYRDFEVIVVDNGSTDGSVAFLTAAHPWVRLVTLPENRGFAGGNNAGYRVAGGEYLVTLNNDTEADPEWLAELVAAADGTPAAGMVASRICSHDEPDRIDSLGVRICRDGMSRGAFRRQRFSELSPAPVEEILLPSACAALYKRAMVAETGFFADSFFAYCEDTDLGLRGRWAGWGAVLATRAVVLHKYSRTGGVFSPFKLYLVERNHYLTVIRNFPLPCLVLVPFFTLVRFLVQARLVVTAQGSGREFAESGARGPLVAAIFRGMLDALRQSPAALRDRARIMGRRRLPSRAMTTLLKRYRLTFAELLDMDG
jgi:GT2 family glycosyltransferase